MVLVKIIKKRLFNHVCVSFTHKLKNLYFIHVCAYFLNLLRKNISCHKYIFFFFTEDQMIESRAFTNKHYEFFG